MPLFFRVAINLEVEAKMKRKLLLVMIIVLSLLLNISVYAAATQEVTANVGAIKITINGKKFVPYDADSKEKMDVLVYQGRTYLPLRALGEAMNAEVNWNEKERKVEILNNW